MVTGAVTSIGQIAARDTCSARQVISLALLAPKLVQGAVEGRLPWVIGVALCASREVASIRHAWFVDLIRGGNFRWRREQGLESQAGFIKPCLDEDTCGLKHPQKAGETRK